MITVTKSKVCIFALVVLSSLFDGASIGTIGSGLMVRATPTPQNRGFATRNVVERDYKHKPGPRRLEFGRQDAEDGDGDTLGRLVRDYNLLRDAVPAAPEGSDLQNALIQEVDQKKETIFLKFGQIVPDDGTAPAPGASTVNSADGALVTVIPNPDGSIIIASNGRNQTVSLGPTSQAGAGDQQAPPSPTSSSMTPTSTSTVMAISTSTASASGTTTTQPPTTASSTTASASASRSNAAVVMRPLDMLPTSMAMKSLFTVTVTMALGAWSVL